MERRYEWLPSCSTDASFVMRNPYIMDLIKYTDLSDSGSITFNGYFYVESAIFPIERVLVKYDVLDTKVQNIDFMHIEIVEKILKENTSEYGEYDEEYGGSICFFPTEIATYKYRILKNNLSNGDMKLILENILAKEADNMKRNDIARREREDREHQEWLNRDKSKD